MGWLGSAVTIPQFDGCLIACWTYHATYSVPHTSALLLHARRDYLRVGGAGEGGGAENEAPAGLPTDYRRIIDGVSTDYRRVIESTGYRQITDILMTDYRRITDGLPTPPPHPPPPSPARQFPGIGRNPSGTPRRSRSPRTT